MVVYQCIKYLFVNLTNKICKYVCTILIYCLNGNFKSITISVNSNIWINKLLSLSVRWLFYTHRGMAPMKGTIYLSLRMFYKKLYTVSYMHQFSSFSYIIYAISTFTLLLHRICELTKKPWMFKKAVLVKFAIYPCQNVCSV